MKFLNCSALAFIVLLASCGSASKTDNDNKLPIVELQSFQYDVIAETASGDSLLQPGSRYTRITGEGVMPVSIGSHDLKLLRDSLATLSVATFVNVDKVEPRVDSDMVINPGLKPEDVDACGSSYNSLTVSLVSPRLLVWKDYASSYVCGAAHGFHRTSFVNYRVSDGKILSLADIMRHGYEDELAQMIRMRLKEDKVDLLIPADQVPVSDVFEITSNGVRFVYRPYEIAPYSEGEVSVNFDAFELEDVLAPGMLSFICGIPE